MSTNSDKMDFAPRPELFDFHGVSMTHYFTDNWDNVQNFKARPDDVFIAMYPKAGNTWVCQILDLLHFGQTAPERDTSIPIYSRVPMLEINIPSQLTGPGIFPLIFKGTEIIDKHPEAPRLIKTHLPVQFFPKSVWEQNCKIVYMGRNAKDSVVSYFHFERMTQIFPEPGDWSSYLQRFMEGRVVFGSWYEHVSNWWKKKQTYPNLHYMFYEDLIQDAGKEIDKLCHFLGLSRSAEEKERIREKVKFDTMKENKTINHSGFKQMDFKVSSFMRKGKVGDWKNHFTVAQSEGFDEDYLAKMKDSTLQFRFTI